MKLQTQKKIPVTMILNKNLDNITDIMIQLMSRFNEAILFSVCDNNTLPDPVLLKNTAITIVDNVYDTTTKLRLQELCIHPIRHIKHVIPVTEPTPIQLPGVSMPFGVPNTPPKVKPKRKPNTTPAPALRMTPVLKKLGGDEQLFEFIVAQHQLYQKDLHARLVAPNLIICFYKIRYPTQLDIDHVARQLDTWARNHPQVRYNPIRKKFCPLHQQPQPVE